MSPVLAAVISSPRRGGRILPPRFSFRNLGGLLFLAAVLVAVPAGAAAGVVDGIAVLGGELQAGVRIWALPTPDFNPAAPAGTVSAPTDDEGKFSLKLLQGRFYLVAFKKGGGKLPGFEPGDYYCFNSGNPVIAGEEPVHLGFNLIRVPDDGRTVPGPTGIEGTILFEGKPLGKCYLYVYQNAEDDFHGMGVHVAPVGPEGKFKVRLPPGTYYLIARQRQEGGMYGPLRKNDRVGTYYANPITLNKGQSRQVILEVISRVDNLEENSPGGRSAGGFTIAGTIRDRAGSPLEGLRVLLYANPETSGQPRFVSDISAADGSFTVDVPLEGTWYLVARRNLGGPPEPGEYYGRWEDRDKKATPVAVGSGKPRVTLNLTAAPAPGSSN